MCKCLVYFAFIHDENWFEPEPCCPDPIELTCGQNISVKTSPLNLRLYEDRVDRNLSYWCHKTYGLKANHTVKTSILGCDLCCAKVTDEEIRFVHTTNSGQIKNEKWPRPPYAVIDRYTGKLKWEHYRDGDWWTTSLQCKNDGKTKFKKF